MDRREAAMAKSLPSLIRAQEVAEAVSRAVGRPVSPTLITRLAKEGFLPVSAWRGDAPHFTPRAITAAVEMFRSVTMAATHD
jgi:hypothetical protein